MTTIEFTTSEILLANCCVLCVARIILYCTTLSWRGSSVNLCKIATPHPLTTVWRQTSEIHTFYFFMQLCTVTAQFSLKWQIVRHPKCCIQQIGQNQLRRNICHRYYWLVSRHWEEFPSTVPPCLLPGARVTWDWGLGPDTSWLQHYLSTYH